MFSLNHSAYLAASRRSDRSIEARVGSARRASEVHRRRTGRSLRITEQDVVNEEIYEEEPMHFNRRLSAYLTNHVAMRSALDQAITNSYAQQYPNALQFVHNQNMYPPQQQSPPSFGPQASHGTPTYSPSMPSPSVSSTATPQPMHAGPALPQTSQMRAPPPFDGMSPFTTSLTAEAQMLLGPALDPNDPFTSTGSETLPQAYNYTTLAPSALDMSPQIYPLPSTTASAYNDSLPDFSKSHLYGGGNSASGIYDGLFWIEGPWRD